MNLGVIKKVQQCQGIVEVFFMGGGANAAEHGQLAVEPVYRFFVGHWHKYRNCRQVRASLDIGKDRWDQFTLKLNCTVTVDSSGLCRIEYSEG